MGVFDGLLQPPERKALFMVGTGNSERKGIGCAVECEGKYYVLTCRDVASPEDAGADNEHEFIFDRYCSNHPKHVGKHRPKALDILCDDKRSFLLLPDDQVLSLHFLLSADSKKKEKVYSYFLSDDGKRAQSIDWSYNNNTRKYSIGRDLDRKNFLGSPVLYSDKTDKTFVVGVVGKEENTYPPIFFESASLPYPGAPSQVYIVPVPREITEDRVTLTWTAPKDNGGVITEYTVYQRKVNGSPSDWEREPTGLLSLQHEVAGLERGKMYEFQVTATNRYGESPKGEDATRGVRVLGVPNQVKIVEYPSEIIEDRVTLTWRAPEDNGTVVTQYTVYQREVNEDGSRSNWKGEATGRDVLQYEVVGLESGKMYEFQVTATNQCGESTRVEKGPNIVQIACVSPDSLLEFLLFKIFSFLNNTIWSWRNWTEG